MRLAYATDLHGNVVALEQFLRLAAARTVDAVIVGGDLTPKHLAIQLPTVTSFDGEAETGGEVFLLNDLRQDPITGTYTTSLERIAEHGRSENTTAAANRLRRAGCIVSVESNQFFELQSMLLEQRVLDKLHAWIRRDLTVSDHAITFTDEELQVIVLDCLPAWFEQLEQEWTSSVKLDFARKALARTDVDDNDFLQVAPSKHIVACLMESMYGTDLTPRLKRWMAELDELQPGQAYLKHRIETQLHGLINASAYRSLINETMIESLVRFTTVELLRRNHATKETYVTGQRKFLEEVFLPAVATWRSTNDQRPVCVILGNDDDQSNELVLKAADQQGKLLYLQGKLASLGPDTTITGTGYVTRLPESITYREWLISDDQMYSYLQVYADSVSGQHILVVHDPPYGVLDQVEGGSVGSHGVRDFILSAQPRLVLVGHIHEAPRLSGTNHEFLGQTLVVNPGGEHDRGVQAVIVDTDTLSVESLSEGGEY